VAFRLVVTHRCVAGKVLTEEDDLRLAEDHHTMPLIMQAVHNAASRLASAAA
jgi:hypothetical protein